MATVSPSRGTGSSGDSIRVLVAFGTPLARDALVVALGDAGFAASQSSADAAAMARALAGQPADIVLLAPLVSPAAGEAPISSVRTVVTAVPAVAVVALLAPASGELARVAIDDGASAVVTVDDGLAGLVDALQAAHRGEIHVGPSLLDALARRAHDPGHRPTDRELDILALVARGWANADIAAHLHCSLRTVEADRARVARRLAIADRRGWVAAAIERGLLR